MASIMYRAGCHRLYFVGTSVGTRDSFLRAQASFLKSSDGSCAAGGNRGGKPTNTTSQHHQHHTQRKCGMRYFTHSNIGGVSSENPYEILGVPNTATYAEAKTAFLKLAMRHHPDTTVSNTTDVDDEEERKRGMEAFVRYRQAFERIRETESGGSAIVGEGDEGSAQQQQWTDEEFIAWYYEEKGRHSGSNVRLDMKTRQEVIDVVNKSSQGGLDRGGIWEWARRLAEEDKMLKENKKNFKRTVGIGAKSETTSNLRRRRRKK